MCYHTALDTEVEAMNKRYHRLMLEETRAHLPFSQTNAFGRPWWPVLTGEDKEHFTWKQWGLVPAFGKNDPAAFLKKSMTFNAKSETAATLASFRDAMNKGKRCLIPVTSFFEWKHEPVPGKKTPKKLPHEITMNGEHIFSLAGLYDGDTYTILTRPAQTLMAEVHNSAKRQPVIIPKAFEGDWLNPNLTQEDVERFCFHVDEHDLSARMIGSTTAA